MAKYDSEKVKEELTQLKDAWELDPEGKVISVSFNCRSFPHAMLLANSVAHIAEKVNHHPGINIDYKKISFSLTTHDKGGLTELDFKLARQIETLNYQPSDSSEW